MKETTLEELLEYCKQNERVCPQPTHWNTMWNKLKNKKQIGNGWEPPLPLILAAWWVAPAMSKQFRLVEHLKWASKEGQLEDIKNFLYNLKEENWFHVGE